MNIELPLLLDGATGSNLIAAGLSSGQSTADFILSHPQVIKDLQREYIESGARVIPTPTFGVNAEKYGKDFADISRRLIRLTKKTVADYGNGKVFVASDISPCGRFLQPMGMASFDDIYADFAMQAKIFEEENVDILTFMTMYSLAEARIALIALKENSNKPIFASMTVDKSGKTMSGNDICACVATLSACGAASVGINCSSGPSDMLSIIKKAAKISTVPLFCKPNAGTDTQNYLPPKKFAEEMRKLLLAGASIVGGCCGTTPEYIKEISQIISEFDTNYFSEMINSRKKYLSENNIKILSTEKNIYELSDKSAISPQFSVEEFIEDFYDFDKEEFSAANVKVESISEAEELLDSAYLIDIPLVVSCKNPQAAELLSRQYCGVLAFSGDCGNDLKKYGSLSVNNSVI